MKLRTKILISILSLITLLTVALSVLYTVLMGSSAEKQFAKHGASVARNLASSGKIGVMLGDSSQLDPVLDVVMLDSEILAASFYDKNGVSLAYRGTVALEQVRDSLLEDASGNSLATFVEKVKARPEDAEPIGYVKVEISRNALQADLSNTLIWSTVLCIVFSFTAIVVVYYIMKLLAPLLEGIRLVATGDLTIELEQKSHDEIGMLIKSLNDLVSGLRNTVKEIRATADTVARASCEISSSTEELAAGAAEQNSQTTEVGKAIDEMARTIRENSKNAADAAATAREAKTAAENGGKVVEETVAGMKKIADVVQRSSLTIRELGNSSNSIGNIISVIDDIADQTNLLALNAAIEAARAGEQGRGFAVVADEVRRLSERTTKATKEIADMIKKIQADTRGAVIAIEEGTLHVDEGIKLAERAGSSLKEIVSTSQRLTDMVAQIASGSDQQLNASVEITNVVEAITHVTRETANGTNQIALTASDLNRLTEDLQVILKQFKLNEGSLEAVRQSGNKKPHSKNQRTKPQLTFMHNTPIEEETA